MNPQLHSRNDETLNQAAKLAAKTKAEFREAVETFNDKAAIRAASGREKVAELDAQPLVHGAAEFVRENPVATVLTALAAGFLAGYSLRRAL